MSESSTTIKGLTVTRHETPVGPAWKWTLRHVTSGDLITYDLVWTRESHSWVRWMQIARGGWTSKPMSHLLPEVTTAEEAEGAAHAYLGEVIPRLPGRPAS